MTSGPLCRILDWDTEFFGARIGRLIPERITAAEMETALAWGRAQSVDCLYYLADPDDRESVRAAENSGFRLVDVRLRLQGEFTERSAIPAPNGEVFVRLHNAADIPRLEAIAAEIYTTTRFYFDPNFNQQAASHLYQTWIRKSCQGAADRVWVAQDGDGPVGFVTCLCKPGSSSGSVGLFGVHPRGRGQGVGGALVHAALNWFLENECWRIQVVTQARNIPALALYQRMGFTIQEVRLWYHRWFEAPERTPHASS